MTANRWWVKYCARWLARIDSIQGQVQMFSLSVTAFSTFSILLQGAGLSRFIPYVGGISFGFVIIYAKIFAEGGVWNQVNRDRVDMSSNYSNPQMRISAEMNAVVLASILKDREITQKDIEETEELADKLYKKYRNGIDER